MFVLALAGSLIGAAGFIVLANYIMARSRKHDRTRHRAS
jgi:hypothetical protein